LKPDLYEVWGDTVDGRHLIYAIAIGAMVSLSAFFIAQYFFVGWVANVQMARAYAMLVGIVGCLAGGVISARLFKPKRHVVEHQADPAWRAQVLIDLQSEYGELGSIADLPAATVAELREMDLYDLFANHESATAPTATAPVSRADDQASAGVDSVSASGGRS
jgi:hypothetical protein